jgi:hypothetical protein
VTITEARPDEPAAPPPTSSHAALVAVIAVVVMLVAALVFVVIGAGARSDASSDHDRADTLAARRATLVHQQARVDRQRIALRKLTDAVPSKVGTLEAALTDVVAAQNRFIDVVNQASSLYANGNHAGAASALQGDGATTIGQLSERNQKVQQALQQAQAALDALKAAK